MPDLIFEFSDLVPKPVDVLPGVRVVELALDQSFLLLKHAQTHAQSRSTAKGGGGGGGLLEVFED